MIWSGLFFISFKWGDLSYPDLGGAAIIPGK
jgi:hypothetical protein